MGEEERNAEAQRYAEGAEKRKRIMNCTTKGTNRMKEEEG